MQAKVPFEVARPASSSGSAPTGPADRPRRQPGALVTYGKGLGGIAVIQTPPSRARTARRAARRLELPKISINGASGQELDTALGTVVPFHRGGGRYTVLGSVPAAAAEAAARAL